MSYTPQETADFRNWAKQFLKNCMNLNKEVVLMYLEETPLPAGQTVLTKRVADTMRWAMDQEFHAYFQRDNDTIGKLMWAFRHFKKSKMVTEAHMDTRMSASSLNMEHELIKLHQRMSILEEKMY